MTDLSEAADHFLHQRPHRGDVDDLELVGVDGAVRIDVFADLMEHRQQRHVGLTRTLW